MAIRPVLRIFTILLLEPPLGQAVGLEIYGDLYRRISMRNLISNMLSHSPHVPLKYPRNPTVVFLSLPLTPWGVGSKGRTLVGPRELLVTFLMRYGPALRLAGALLPS